MASGRVSVSSGSVSSGSGSGTSGSGTSGSGTSSERSEAGYCVPFNSRSCRSLVLTPAAWRVA
jgi:hypothetical protein